MSDLDSDGSLYDACYCKNINIFFQYLNTDPYVGPVTYLQLLLRKSRACIQSVYNN